MTNPLPEERDAAKDAALAATAIGAVMTIVALGVYGGRTATSVAIGAAIAISNLLTLRAIIRAIIRPPEDQIDEGADAPDAPRDHKGEGKRGGTAWGIFALLKILFLFGGIWFLLTRGLVDPIPLVVGYGVLPLGIASSSLLSSLRPHR